MPAVESGLPAPTGLLAMETGSFSTDTSAQCFWLSGLGHICAPVAGDSEHWDLVPAHGIQVIIQGQQDLRRKVQARFRSC